jgi:hypothetical protein
MQNRDEFLQYLIAKEIPHRFENDDLWVRDIDLLPYRDEIKEKFPDFEFLTEVVAHRRPPGYAGDPN